MDVKKIIKNTIMECLSGITEMYNEKEIKVGTYKNFRMTIELLENDGDCIIRRYRKDSNLFAEVNYKNYKRNGIGKIYYKNGALYRLSLYSDNQLTYTSEYNVGGVLKKHTKYKNSRKHGLTKLFDNFGKCRGIRKYKNGRLKKEIDILYNGKIETIFDGYGLVEYKRQYLNDILIAECRNYPNKRVIYYDTCGNYITTIVGYRNDIKMADIYKI